MSNGPESEFTIVHEKASAFYDTYERKEELQHQTHYCPGCGHGIVHKMVAQAIDELGIQDRTILISPVGCSVFAYYYFDVGNVQAAHGRAPAVATAVKRTRPDSIVIGYQGDGDLAAIGSAEILHAANRGENISVIFVNNAIYSMTGGQMAPTTLMGQGSTTTPGGRTPEQGYPLHVCELLATLQAPVYLERVALGDNKQVAQAARAVRKAIENQVNSLGFSLVEILSPCPTIWKMSAVEAQRWVHDVMEKTFAPGVYRDKTSHAESHSTYVPPMPLEKIPAMLGIAAEKANEWNVHDAAGAIAIESGEAGAAAARDVDLQVRVAGFGGQGVLLLGEMLAEAGLDAGLEVSWLPSYGPEMRSGTSNCHVRLAREPIDSPLVEHPHVLVAMNEPSLHKFAASVRPGGWILYNGEDVSPDCERRDVQIVARSFTHLADELGDARAANMVALGAVLEIAQVLPQASVDHALGKLVKSPRWLDLDERALTCGREALRAWRGEACHAG
jgi:2-oxoisovalerate ferredoxin oxidoreductase beta subunit